MKEIIVTKKRGIEIRTFFNKILDAIQEGSTHCNFRVLSKGFQIEFSEFDKSSDEGVYCFRLPTLTDNDHVTMRNIRRNFLLALGIKEYFNPSRNLEEVNTSSVPIQDLYYLMGCIRKQDYSFIPGWSETQNVLAKPTVKSDEQRENTSKVVDIPKGIESIMLKTTDFSLELRFR
jgi:hypothetical protein